MSILVELLVNTRAATLPRKRSILSLLVLMLIITFFVAFFFLNSDFLESKIIVDDENVGDISSPTPSPAPSLVPTSNPSHGTNYNPENFPPTEIFVVPEYSLGGGLFALFTCFIAFTFFIRYKNSRNHT